MATLTIGTRVRVGDYYDGTIIDRHETEGLIIVKLDGDFDELPTDLCEWHLHSGAVLWAAYVDELEVL